MTDITVKLSGTFREQGRQHGEALGPVIREITGEVLTWDTWKADRTEWAIGLCEANMLRLCPGLVEEMQGIAEGSGLPYRDILAYNALADIWMAQLFCTAMGWRDTPDGPIIGKTNDVGRHREKYHWPFRRTGGDGGAAIWATWPGSVWTNAFVTESGLAGGGASLGMQARNESGIPCNAMWRVLMDNARDVPDVLRVCAEVPVMHHPQHNVLADAQGKLMTIELTPETTYVCQGPELPYVRATNHFCAGPYEGRDNGELRHVINSKNRFANLGALAESLEHTSENMLGAIRNHAAVGQICQHGNADMWSSTGYVMIPQQRRMLIGRGQPCEVEFVEMVL